MKTAFWRILFEIRNGNVVLNKEITLWNVEPVQRDRIDRQVRIRLTSSIGTRVARWTEPIEVLDMVNVTLNNDAAHFQNGYIQFEDLPLNSQIATKNDIEWDDIGLSEAKNADGIAIWAEVNLPNEPHDLGPFPLFYYPQDQHVQPEPCLALSVIGPPSARRLDWRVRRKKEPEMHGTSASYALQGSGEGLWQTVTVRQDRRPHTDPGRHDVFEFVVDSMHLGMKEIATSGEPADPDQVSFPFDFADRTCYIGRVCDPALPGGWRDLTGQIRSLVFDPNDSCPTCRGR
jgi:hypothetical protein